MARDYRHGHAKRNGFQRKSQAGQTANQTDKLVSNQWLWLGGLLISVGLIAAFFIVQHFASQGVKATETRANEIYQAEESLSGDPSANPQKARVSEQDTRVEKQALPDVTASVDLEVTESTEAPLEAEPKFTFYYDLAHTEVVVDVEPLPIELPEPMWIQAGSFRELAQAQREQKRLSNASREVEISPIETRNGLFYRIMLGPFNDRLIMNQQRNELRRLGADTRVVRIRSED